MKMTLLTLLFFFSPLGDAQNTAPRPNRVSHYKLEWELRKVPFTVEMYSAPLTLDHQVGETKVIQGIQELQILSPSPDGTFDSNFGQPILIYLVLKNTSDKEVRFSVAPHSTTPNDSTLGFRFKCLCTAHIYHVPPKGTWSRLMKIEPNDLVAGKTVQLKHIIFAIDPKK